MPSFWSKTSRQGEEGCRQARRPRSAWAVDGISSRSIRDIPDDSHSLRGVFHLAPFAHILARFTTEKISSPDLSRPCVPTHHCHSD
ncbi:hypothetical protein JTE90_008116 [Oedothorax gibbosus]|uniref:Uncharacterized protein n=1 Tax=Oedothorax gibbosus TaxID=931172 RepID=A0AAV6UFY5_9ARAC|nr:hypothetical protein JTE90_008116 [Oedothorax gibbosus]